MTPANETRRTVMNTAWGFRRSEPSRAFADCLRGAWAFVKRMDVFARKLAAKAEGAAVLQLSPSLIRSPIQRATRGQRHGRRADFRAAYLTARIGR